MFAYKLLQRGDYSTVDGRSSRLQNTFVMAFIFLSRLQLDQYCMELEDSSSGNTTK